jgi:hypothetical protein
MPRSKSKRKVLRLRWKVQKKHRLERQKAAKEPEKKAEKKAEKKPEKKAVRKR